MSTTGSIPIPAALNAMSAGRGAQYLTLRLGGEEYAIDILSVKEIRKIGRAHV